MTEKPVDHTVEAMRAFTRFYTKKAGVLNELLLESNFGLTEARIIYELTQAKSLSARNLSLQLELDPGYVSRVLKKFEKQGLVTKEASEKDRRSKHVSLTDKGRHEYLTLDTRSAKLFETLIEKMNTDNRARMLDAMKTIEHLLAEPDVKPSSFTLRPHRAGDIGWIVQAHGQFYTQEYGWDATFEAMVAEIASSFLKEFSAQSDCCWIAEKDGMRIGSAMVVRADDETAKLRLVIVDPIARGLGVGIKLVEECLHFARTAGYKRMTLWTNANLHAAIAIYEKLGFELVSEEPHHSYGKDLVGQYWQRDL